MKGLLLFFFMALLLVSCRKDNLEGEYAILQGKWKYIGSTENRTNKLTGNVTETWFPSSDFPDKYFLEFEKKGKVVYWINDREEKYYRIETVFGDKSCDQVQNCQYLAINLNFDPQIFLRIFTNEDTMKVSSEYTHVPLNYYEDQAATYSYLHTFVRIN